ncbi:MAG: tyrosine-type recombinase/integrase [Armatimonadota bacterium]
MLRRLSQLLNIRLADVDWDQGIIKVMGKGRKERLANIATSTKVILRRYVRKCVDPEAGQYLFQNQYGSPISRSYVAGILRAAGQRVGIENVHPHRLRHSFATQYLSNGGNALTLQRELGHSSLEMVKRYVALQHKDITRKHIQYSPANQLNLHSRKRRSRIE